MLIVQKILTSFELLVDSVEQSKSCPFNNLEQQNYYSGKKKQHTRKNQFVSLPKGADIVDVEVSIRGSTADINLFCKQENLTPNKDLETIKHARVAKILLNLTNKAKTVIK